MEKVTALPKVLPRAQRVPGPKAGGVFVCAGGQAACGRAAQSRARPCGRTPGSRLARLRRREVPDVASRALRGCRASFCYFPLPHRLCLVAGVARVPEMVPEHGAFPTAGRCIPHCHHPVSSALGCYILEESTSGQAAGRRDSNRFH